MTEIFGYGIANKFTGKQLRGAGRAVYDSKSAASGALTREKKRQAWYMKEYGQGVWDNNPEECEVVALVAYVPTE